MEKKKLLLVAISVGVFLVIAIGAAIILVPKNSAAPSGAVSSRPAPGTGTGITVNSNPPLTPYPPTAVETPVPVNPEPANVENPQPPQSLDPVNLVRNGDIPGLAAPPEGSVPKEDFHVSGTGETVISVRKPNSAAIPDAPPAGRAVAAPRQAPPPKPASAPRRAPAPKPSVQPKIYDDYWVQTGAFSTVARAEGVKETLAAKGITSIIENRDVDGKTMFRVRVGPYTSQNEADYWLSLIKSLDGFGDSQIRQTQSRR